MEMNGARGQGGGCCEVILMIQVREDENLNSRGWRSKWIWSKSGKRESAGSGDWGWMGKNLGWAP